MSLIIEGITWEEISKRSIVKFDEYGCRYLTLDFVTAPSDFGKIKAHITPLSIEDLLERGDICEIMRLNFCRNCRDNKCGKCKVHILSSLLSESKIRINKTIIL